MDSFLNTAIVGSNTNTTTANANSTTIASNNAFRGNGTVPSTAPAGTNNTTAVASFEVPVDVSKLVACAPYWNIAVTATSHIPLDNRGPITITLDTSNIPVANTTTSLSSTTSVTVTVSPDAMTESQLSHRPGWHQPSYHETRRNQIARISTLLTSSSNPPDVSVASSAERIRGQAATLERAMYYGAPSYEVYLDETTLVPRIVVLEAIRARRVAAYRRAWQHQQQMLQQQQQATTTSTTVPSAASSTAITSTTAIQSNTTTDPSSTSATNPTSTTQVANIKSQILAALRGGNNAASSSSTTASTTTTNPSGTSNPGLSLE